MVAVKLKAIVSPALKLVIPVEWVMMSSPVLTELVASTVKLTAPPPFFVTLMVLEVGVAVIPLVSVQAKLSSGLF